MTLIIFEIRKLFSKRLTVITMIVLLSIMAIVAITDWHDLKNKLGNINEYNKMVKSYEGKIDNELANTLEKKLEAEESKNNITSEDMNPNLSFEEKRILLFQNDYINSEYNARTWISLKEEDSKNPSSITGLENLVKTLESNNKQNTYLYSDILKHLNMLKVVNEPGYYNDIGWGKLYIFLLGTPGTIFTLIVLLIAISPIFSNEQRNGMERIILATKNGHYKIVSAKIIASLVFTIAWVTCFYILSFLVYIIPYKNLSAWNMPLNSINGYVYTPYNLNVLQGLGVSYLMTILLGCTLAVLFCLISALQKTSLSSIALAVIIILAPMFITDSGLISKFLSLSPSVAISGNMLLREYSSFNIMGKPIIYPIVASITSIIIFTISTFATFKAYNNKIKF